MRSLDPVSVSVLDVPTLASLQGGPVAVEGQNTPLPGGAGNRSALAPVEAVYLIAVAATADGAEGPRHITRGVARVDGESRSLAERFWRVAAAVLIRETGF